MGKGKPSGIRAGRKLRIHRRSQRWASKVSVHVLSDEALSVAPVLCTRLLDRFCWESQYCVLVVVFGLAYVRSDYYYCCRVGAEFAWHLCMVEFCGSVDNGGI